MSFSTPSQSLGYLRCHLFQPRGQVPTQVVEREPCAAVAATCGLDRVPDLNRAGTHVLALGRRHRHSTDDRHPDNQEVLRSGRSSQSVALSSGFPPSPRPCASTARAVDARRNGELIPLSGWICQGAAGGGFRRFTSSFHVGVEAIIEQKCFGGFFDHSLVILLVTR